MKLTNKRIEYTDSGRPYIIYIRQSGRYKGTSKKCYGKIFKCKKCQELSFVRYGKINRKEYYCKHCAYTIHKHNWKGGRVKDSNGYIKIYSPNHKNTNSNKYIFEHRLVMEKKLGRLLSSKERIHHKNGIRDDNRTKNLRLFKNDSEHYKWHYKEKEDSFNLLLLYFMMNKTRMEKL